MAEVPLPTPTKVPVPSTDIRNAVFAGAKLDEEVTGTGDFYTDRLDVKRLTNTGRNNQFNAAQQERADQFQQFLLSSGYVFLGDYEDGPFQFGARNQYIRYDNQYYRLNATTDVGFTTTGTDATSFANDVTHFVLMDGDTLRQNLGSGEGLKYIGFCNSLGEMRAVIPDQINQKISLLGVYSGDAAGGDEFISVNATEHPADNQGVCFNSGDPSFNWYRLRVLREKIIYLEDFSCVESTPDNLTDCTTQLKNAFTWATAQESGVYKIKSRGNFYKISGSLGVVDFGFTEIAFDSPVTIYAPDSASITEEYTVFEFKMTQRNSVEQSYQSRSMVGDNLNVKGTNRRTSLVTAYYIHDMWGCNLGISYHGVGTGIVFGSNVWCIGIRGLLSAQLCISNEKATSTAGENICFMPGSALYNSGQLMDLSHYQFFVNMFGTSLDYTPGQPDRPALDLGNSVVNHIGGHTEYAGPSYSAFVRVNGDFGGCHIIGGELLLVVDSSIHYAYFAETKRDYQFSIRDTAVFGTRMVGTALCNRKMRYAPTVNYGSTQNISCISDNGGNVLYDPTFSAAAIKDKWHVVGGTQTDRFTTAFAAISVVAHSNAGSGYALKISKLVTGAGNNVSVRLEVKSKNVFLSPRISFKIESSADVTGQVITNLNPWLVNIRDAYGIALSAGRVMTSQTPRSTSFDGMAANEPVTVTLNTVEMVSTDNIPPDIYLLDIALQNLPIGTYYIYDVNYCQGDA
ncbi:hypothetical protein [Raoultella ornithinolytica]|uniref:hypothetical protein n=1 Tax=Raoultella ornithinolytica TaxID=54291 RepID=UPI001F1FEE2A|nr:hypothetical protein [Raoultella ornithinolytica]MCF6685177.1 hypothetical protein [Raoultella ornithinolytica]